MQRVVAIDLARFIAIVGMMAAHLLTSVIPGPLLENVTSGFPSTLFAVLGGFGVVFASRKYLVQRRFMASFVAISTRGLVVLVIGLIMEGFPDHPIAVILVYYGFAIIVGAIAVLLPTWLLVALAVLGSIVGPLLLTPIRDLTSGFMGPQSLSYGGPAQFLISVFATGTYPVLTWSVYLTIGIVIARLLLSSNSPTQQRRIALLLGLGAGGAWAIAEIATTLRINAIAPILAQINNLTEPEISQALRANMFGTPFNGGWDAILIASPHSGSTADILRTGGASVLLICVLVIVFSSTTRTPTVLQPLAKVGASPLTVYVLHIALTAYSLQLYVLLVGPANWWEALENSAVMGASFWWQLTIMLGLGVYWMMTGRRGPLELLTTKVSAWAVRTCRLDEPAAASEPPR